MVLTIIVFLVILSILVLVHEFGHFLVGRINGIKVEEFALGLPFTRSLFSVKTRSGMQLSLYPVLFGGFVRLFGEEKEEKGKQSFSQKSVWQRIAVVAAGVAMNFLLAVGAFYLFLSLTSFRVLVARISEYRFVSPHETAVVITGVAENSPAKSAGIKSGDVVLGYHSLPDFQQAVKSKVGTPIELTLTNLELDKYQKITVVPRVNPPPGEGALGVSISEAIILQYHNGQEKLLSGLLYSWDMFFYNLHVLARFVGKSAQDKDISPLAETVSGPVGIAGVVGEILQLGGKNTVVNLINLLGLLSLSLALMNILPFPALDGGRLVFLLVEAVSGRKVPGKVENLIHQIGMAVLLLLIILISAKDFLKIFSR